MCAAKCSEGIPTQAKRALLLSCLWFLSTTSHAALDSAIFTGSLSSVTDPQNYLQSALGLTVSQGDPFTLRYAVDFTNSTVSIDPSPPPDDVAIYSIVGGATNVVTVDFGLGGFASNNDPEITIAIANNLEVPLLGVMDIWTFDADFGQFADGLGGEIGLSISAQFIDPTSERHDGASYYLNSSVTGWLDPRFTLAVRRNGSSETDVLLAGPLLEGSALVPIPAPFWLFTPAIGMLLLRRRVASKKIRKCGGSVG